jgi:hypothetical protein
MSRRAYEEDQALDHKQLCISKSASTIACLPVTLLNARICSGVKEKALSGVILKVGREGFHQNSTTNARDPAASLTKFKPSRGNVVTDDLWDQPAFS